MSAECGNVFSRDSNCDLFASQGLASTPSSSEKERKRSSVTVLHGSRGLIVTLADLKMKYAGIQNSKRGKKRRKIHSLSHQERHSSKELFLYGTLKLKS